MNPSRNCFIWRWERCKMRKSGNVARRGAEISSCLTSDHVSFTKTKSKNSSHYNLQLSFFKCLLDVTPKAYKARQASLTKHGYVILHSDTELLLNKKRWMSGCKECVSFKGEATKLSSSVHLKSWEPYKSLRVSAVSMKTSDILQVEYYVPFFPHPPWPQSARDMTLRASYELRAH